MATASRSFPPATDPASGQGHALEARAQAFLLRLTRAVQRASIYPPGHPAVSQGVAPVVEALRDLVREGPVTIAVGRTRLLVAGGDRPPTEHDTPWLANRLFDRELSAVTMTETQDASDVGRFVAWLSAADTGDLPEISGITLTRFDGRRVRFRDADAGRADTPQALVNWHVLTAPLREAYGVAEHDAAGADPVRFADRIRESLHASEGTGVTDLADRLVQLLPHVRPLDADSRAIVSGKLASLVSGLSPELRGTLLTTSAHDEPEKLALVEELLPFVSPSVLTDIASNVAIEPGELTGPFARFLRKLSRVAAQHPAAGDVLDARVRVAGLPASLVRGDDDAEHGTVVGEEHVAALSHGGDFVPSKYGARLEQLSTAVLDTAAGHPGLAIPAFDEAELEEHLARIALLQLRHDLTGPDALAFLQWLLDVLPREGARGGIGVLSEVADVLLRLRAVETALSPEMRAVLGRSERAFAAPAVVTLAIEAISALPVGAGDLSAAMLLAGGTDSARQALTWMRTAAAADARIRVAAVLASVETEAFKRTIGPLLGDNGPAAEALVETLDQVDPARAIDVAIVLTSHPSVAIRRRATDWLLRVPLSHARLHRVLQRAFEDADPDIIALALDACARRPSPAAADVLASFVSRRASAALRPLQARAARVLGDTGADGLTRLADLLHRRRWVLASDDRRLSVTIAAVLSRGTSMRARAAARSWRWSPAGVLSTFTRGVETTS